MVTSPHATTPAVGRLLEDYSVEMTGRDVVELESARRHLPTGTRVNVTFLANEDQGLRVSAAAAVRARGLTPVPHIAARRLTSQAHLEDFLRALAAAGASEDVFVVGGDPSNALGPYPDALSVIRSGLLQRHGVRRVGIAGYPEGHPLIAGPLLWRALRDKLASLEDAELEGSIVTQFSLDVDAVLSWTRDLRASGVAVPVRVGIPGPAGIKRLLRFAARLGVGTSAGLARKYGLSVTNLAGNAGPDRFLRRLADLHDEGTHGPLAVHFFTFGGLAATAAWVQEFRTAS